MDPGKTVVKRGQVIQSIVQHSAFDAFFGVVVIANAFYIGKEQKIGEGMIWMNVVEMVMRRFLADMSQKLWKENSWKHMDLKEVHCSVEETALGITRVSNDSDLTPP